MPVTANCTLQMVAERPAAAPEALPAVAPISAVIQEATIALQRQRPAERATGNSEPLLLLRI